MRLNVLSSRLITEGRSADEARRVLGRTGLSVGRLGLGTWEIGDQKTPVEDVRMMVRNLLDGGGNLIDTADNYDDAESIIGEAITGFGRDDLVLVTKCGDYSSAAFDRNGLSTNSPEYRYYGRNFTPKVIRKNVETSLQKLHTDHVDVLLIHTAYLDVLKKGDAIDTVIRMKEQGKARFIGYSGDNEEAVYCAQIPEFSVLETSVNLADMRNLDGPVPMARKAGMGVIAKRPVANTFWRNDLYQRAAEYRMDYRRRVARMKLEPDDLGFEDGHPGWMKLALAFTASTPVDVLAVGTTKPAHMVENIRIMDGLGAVDRMHERIRPFFERARNSVTYSKGRVWPGLE